MKKFNLSKLEIKKLTCKNTVLENNSLRKKNLPEQTIWESILSFIFPIRPFEIARQNIYLNPRRLTHSEMSNGQMLRAFLRNY